MELQQFGKLQPVNRTTVTNHVLLLCTSTQKPKCVLLSPSEGQKFCCGWQEHESALRFVFVG